MPKRIQRRRTKGWRMPANAVSVTRPGPCGNPFTGPGAAQAFRVWILSGTNAVVRRFGRSGVKTTIVSPEDSEDRRARIETLLPELRGKDLACYCPLDKPCHADVLLELANRG